ncbi:MAG: family 78 glycoside hydrolase catalytic domain [Muribaculaceae bacterium]|nr:family 78 glycoside hydrolase catalytic domain [Muribaculaceae bacterium]
MIRSIIVSAALTLAAACSAAVNVGSLTSELQPRPLGLEQTPRLGWKITSDEPGVMQKAYHILVASDSTLLTPGKADIWDSGRVLSDASQWVPCGATEIPPMSRVYWAVQVETNRGTSPWSKPAQWGTGIPGGETKWDAEWIGGRLPGDDPRKAIPARYMRKPFATDKGKEIRAATLYICGLGTYEAYLNGHRVGDAVLQGPPTRFDALALYDAHDVTDLLRSGDNTLGVVLGNGRFAPERMRTMVFFGYPRLLARLEIVYADGSRSSVVSDGSWRLTTDGPIRANSEFDGEIYDAFREMPSWNANGFNDSAWVAAPVTGGPGGKLQYAINPPLRIKDHIMARTVTRRPDGSFLVDMGVNHVGWLRLKLRGDLNAGDTIRVRFAETLSPDSSLYVTALRSAKPCDTYIYAGPGEVVYQPTFTYHGFRYATVEGLNYQLSPNEVTSMVVYDDMPATGSFSCGNDVINTVYANAVRGIRSNYRGFPTDCPQRDERLSWLGDRTTGAYGEAFPFGNYGLYRKWLDDIASCQRDNGGLPDICPNYWDVFSDNLTWPAAYPNAADMLMKQYGDSAAVRRHYPAMKKWLDHMKHDYMHGYIVERDEYGDWCLPPEGLHLIHSSDPERVTDGALLATAHLYYLSNLLSRFATIAGDNQGAAELKTDADSIRTAFNRRFYDPARGCYRNYTVTANLLPLRFGLVDDANRKSVFNHIVATTRDKYNDHVSVGVIGIQHLMRGLSENGRPDLALKIASAKDYPSWGYMASRGATTIWELWNGDTAAPDMNSGNHVMLLGDLLIWEYEILGGISNAEGSSGYKKIRLAPLFDRSLGHVDCTYESIYGPIVSNWAYAPDGTLSYHFEIPANTTAEVYLPADMPATGAASLLRKEGNRNVYLYHSGSYTL